MNGLATTNPFTLQYPTAVQTSLPSGASFARYDPTGRYIVGGRPDGTAVVWDLETKASIRWLDGHLKAITSVDWSRNARFILTSSKDWNIIIWDLASSSDPSTRYTTVRFNAPVLSASFHPRNMRILLVLLTTSEVYLVDLRKEHRGRYELVDMVEDSDEDGQGRARAVMTVARFEPSGRHIFVGTAQATILVFNTRTQMLVGRHRISGAGIIRGLGFAKGGRRLITNSSDRVLRQFNLPTYPSPPSSHQATPARGNPAHIDSDANAEDDSLTDPTVSFEVVDHELEPVYRFNDPITKVAWHNMAYSPNGEWLAGGSADPATHKIYIWDISSDGQFATALDGGREPLLDVHWHPKLPAVASTTMSGNILLWHNPTPERWGAFAGGFEEVDENVEYEEREDEFDIEDEDEIAQRKMKEEDAVVDIDGENDAGKDVSEEGKRQNEPKDDDVLWAEDDPDEDDPGWKMKVLVVDDDGY